MLAATSSHRFFSPPPLLLLHLLGIDSRAYIRLRLRAAHCAVSGHRLSLPWPLRAYHSFRHAQQFVPSRTPTAFIGPPTQGIRTTHIAMAWTKSAGLALLATAASVRALDLVTTDEGMLSTRDVEASSCSRGG